MLQIGSDIGVSLLSSWFASLGVSGDEASGAKEAFGGSSLPGLEKAEMARGVDRAMGVAERPASPQEMPAPVAVRSLPDRQPPKVRALDILASANHRDVVESGCRTGVPGSDYRSPAGPGSAARVASAVQRQA